MGKSPRVCSAAVQALASKGDRTLREVAAQYPVPAKRVPVWNESMAEQAS